MMNFYIDEDKQEIVVDRKRTIPLYSKEGFQILSKLWLKVGWDQKHMYSFTWLGRPFIQIPEDALRIQEVIYSTQPDVIIETGIAHGGSLIFCASICKAMNKGRVIGVDIEIRSHNRKAIEEHALFELITLIEADSTSPQALTKIKSLINPNEKVLVILDSAHVYPHVAGELKLYSPLVSVGSYIVATDGSMECLGDTPRAKRDYGETALNWKNNNPKRAAEDFVSKNHNFKIVEPSFLFNEGQVDFRITHWPSAFVQRIK